jgi:hypothetical protein
MFKWLRRRREAARRDAEDAGRLRKRNDDGESASNPDPSKSLSASSASPMRAVCALIGARLRHHGVERWECPPSVHEHGIALVPLEGEHGPRARRKRALLVKFRKR